MARVDSVAVSVDRLAVTVWLAVRCLLTDEAKVVSEVGLDPNVAADPGVDLGAETDLRTALGRDAEIAVAKPGLTPAIDQIAAMETAACTVLPQRGMAICHE